MKRLVLPLLAFASLAVPPLYAGVHYLTIVARDGGDGSPELASPVVSPPSLPLPANARVMAFGHSYIDRGWATSSTVPGVQILGRGAIPYVDALEQAEARASGVTGRFNMVACYEESGTKWVSNAGTRLSCADQGFYGDVMRSGIAGASGVPSTMRRTPYIVARSPQIAYLDIGINDVRLGRTADQVIADLDRQIGLLTSRGIWVVVQTLSYPKDGAQAAYAGAISRINGWILSQAGRTGVRICDTMAIDGTLSAPTANFAGDMLHISPAGARARAEILWPLLKSMVVPSSTVATGALDTVDNIWPLRGQPGTAGTKTNVTGDVATGYNLTRTSGVSTYVASKEVIAPGNERQLITVTPVDNGTVIHSVSFRSTAQYSYAALGLAPGDWYELSTTIQLDGWAGWEVASGDQQTAALYSEGYDSALTTGYSNYANLAGMPGRTVRLTIVGKIPSGGDRFRWSNRMIQLFHRSDVGGTGTARIGEPVLRKIGSPLPAWQLP